MAEEQKWIYADEEWIKDLTEKAKELDYYKGYAKGLEYGYKLKEYDRNGDCKGCKYSEGKYFRERCEGCCRNYADGYVAMVAEQTEPNLSDIPTTTEDCSMVDPLHDDCFDCDKFFTCDNKGEDYKTDCPWK